MLSCLRGIVSLKSAFTPCRSEFQLAPQLAMIELKMLCRGLGWIVSPRDIVGIQDTIFHDDGKVERVQTSIPDGDKPPVSGRVRATLTLAGWVLLPHERGTNVTYVVKSESPQLGTFRPRLSISRNSQSQWLYSHQGAKHLQVPRLIERLNVVNRSSTAPSYQKSRRPSRDATRR